MKEQLERDRKTYREMYGEEMPEMKGFNVCLIETVFNIT